MLAVNPDGEWPRERLSPRAASGHPIGHVVPGPVIQAQLHRPPERNSGSDAFKFEQEVSNLAEAVGFIEG